MILDLHDLETLPPAKLEKVATKLLKEAEPRRHWTVRRCHKVELMTDHGQPVAPMVEPVMPLDDTDPLPET